jgi:hypothetical protein
VSFVVGNRALGMGFTGERAILDLGDMGGKGLGLSLLSLAIGLLMLLGQLGGIQGDKAHGGQGHVSLLIFDLHSRMTLRPYHRLGPSPWRLAGRSSNRGSEPCRWPQASTS